MDKRALYNITYGLYLLTANENGRDNGCVVNTVIQIANNPTRISVAVLKNNQTCDMIKNTGVFNVSSLTKDTKFEFFRHFGMQSGRDVNKFEGFDNVERSENGLYYLTENTNMYLSAKITDQLDLGSHMLFIGEVTAGEVLSDKEPCTYSYYQSDIKQTTVKAEKKQWVCSVCGYVYEGEELPDDFICPWCNHGKEDFVLSGGENTQKPKEDEKKSSDVDKYTCTICGYVHEGSEPPEVCPVCLQPSNVFVKS